ncbi:S8 family serine peptidase [Actinomycetospora termitidis]|uniref:S8 family serine peptidase n=1 Tax=Actinomycetospora termitidis TaxID=3053470 RepID=A0ABT7M465_9PSEU|nr:S8 family serine peptidase [Actinomycetospora sp. Odt1-22]MDL5155468.1 S8 family serine peptidase [Actinomycetospora sp. Odt1-22]
MSARTLIVGAATAAAVLIAPVAAAPRPAAGTQGPIAVAPPDPPPPDAAALAALPRRPDALPGLVRLGPCPGGVTPGALESVTPEPDAVPGADGRGAVVAVVDSGVAAHPRLSGGVSDAGDFLAADSARDDCDGHGTAVAGVVAAAPGPDDGVVGVAPGAAVVAVRAESAWFSSDAGPTGDEALLARAVRAAVDTPGVDVLTLALAACRPAAELIGGTVPALGALRAALRDATERDVVVVAAAGNVGGACPANDPAGAGQRVVTVPVPAWFGSDADVLAVGALDADGAPDRSSLAGPWVGLAAPGAVPAALDARSGGLTADLTLPGSAPGPVVGTSFAAARVAGAASLLRARFPTMPAREVVARLRTTAAPVPGGTPPTVGAGALDVAAALAGRRPDPPPPPEPAPVTGGRTGWALGVGAAAVAAVLVGVGVRRRRAR